MVEQTGIRQEGQEGQEERQGKTQTGQSGMNEHSGQVRDTQMKTGQEAGRQIERFTAYKIWISDLTGGTWSEKTEQGQAGYVDAVGRKIARVNIIATVIDKFARENYASLTLDDGSGQMRLKLFGDISLFSDISVGDIILAVSRVRFFNNEIYGVPELLRKVNAKHALLRRLELTQEYGKRQPAVSVPAGQEGQAGQTQTGQAQVQIDKVSEKGDGSGSESGQAGQGKENKETERERVVKLLEEMDSGDGVDIDKLLLKFKSENMDSVKAVLEQLLEEGEAYEPRPGKIRIIS